MEKKFVLPALGFDYSALEPAISGEIMRLHHLKHHNAYVSNLNTANEKYALAATSEDLTSMVRLQSDIAFNGGGHFNHTFFFSSLKPTSQGGGEPPTGEFLKLIKLQWGSLNSFVEKFNSQAAAIKGSGWCWLTFVKESKSLSIDSTQNHEMANVRLGHIPLLVIDMWEHAFYLQYKNVKADYLKAIWQVVNWSTVQERFEKACELTFAVK